MSKEIIEQLNEAQKLALVNNGNLFCWRTFLTGWVRKLTNFVFETILSPEFLVWVIFTVIFFSFYAKDKEIMPLLIYAGISVIFIIARSVRHVLENKTTLEIKAQANASANAALTGNISELVKTTVEKIREEKS